MSCERTLHHKEEKPNDSWLHSSWSCSGSCSVCKVLGLHSQQQSLLRRAYPEYHQKKEMVLKHSCKGTYISYQEQSLLSGSCKRSIYLPTRDSTWHLKTWRRHLIEGLRRPSGGHWENLLWRSGFCDWCRGCMPMCEAMSVLVRSTLKSLKWKSMLIKAWYSAHCSSSLCLKPCHRSSALGFPVRTSMPMTLLSLLHRSRNVSGGSWLGKKQWRRNEWE